MEGPAADRAARRRVILALETSCDETAAALVDDDGTIRSNVVSRRPSCTLATAASFRRSPRGGISSSSCRCFARLWRRGNASLDDVTRIGVTRGPGLIGALLVGISAAKALAWARRLPLAAVDHLHGHVASLFLEPGAVEPPFLCLLASGGHTLLLDVQARDGFHVLGTTLDDAAGEAFDKGARLLGLGYPGGAAIDRLAREGDPAAYDFPRARVPGLDFSFSGVKTALLYAVRDLARRSWNAAAPISPRATSARSSARSSSERVRPRRRRVRAGSRSSAVSPRTPSFAPPCEMQLSPRWNCARTTRR